MKGLTSRRGSAPPAYPEPPIHAPNAALLIDFDNVTMGVRSDLQNQLRTLLDSEVFKGKISVQRAYADWRRYPQYIVPLSEASIDLIFAPAFGSNKKNATDIRLAIDALELVFTRQEIGTFILLSGDSDFSSLVLKLKEYGKYVIGVGIRESSSDLLIQNCDEYFSYNELTGLLKEGEIEHRRRDPWELVVEAASRMQENGDVMRSDRLKQVMQEIDPNFDEKDAGFSRYSKFLAETQRRGLLRLTKMENGQYEIALGNNANVHPDLESPPAQPSPSRGGNGESRSRRRRGGPRNAAEGMTLAEAFQLLRRALEKLGAVGSESTDADQAREEMQSLHGEEDPIFDGGRFHRMLRQAHDAGVVDLAKADGDAYLVRLNPPKEDAGADAEEASDDASGGSDSHRRGRRSRGGRGRGGRSARGRSSASSSGGESAHSEDRKERGAEERHGRGAKSEETEASSETPQRNPRFRRGSRSAQTGTATPDQPLPGPVEPTASSAVSEPAPSTEKVHRSVRGRRGSRSAPRGPSNPSSTVIPHPVGPSSSSSDTSERPPDESEKRQASEGRQRPEAPASSAPASTPTPPPEAGGGLLERMSAALHRAVVGKRERDVDE